jgi:hypothetical protein
MASTRQRQAPQPTPITTVAEIDEALWWTTQARPRNDYWYRWVDALLDQRLRIAKESSR